MAYDELYKIFMERYSKHSPEELCQADALYWQEGCLSFHARRIEEYKSGKRNKETPDCFLESDFIISLKKAIEIMDKIGW